MRKLREKLLFLGVFSLVILSGCSGFTGLREPLYDGRPIARDEEAIALYQETGEIIGEERDFYFRYPFSEDIYQPSLDYPDNEPELLEVGEYTVGEDIPAGRATLLGNESVFTSENYEVHLGNFILRDEADEIYFENLFHTAYGQLVAQVDLIEGHTIEIIGRDAEITAFYSPEIPEDPYELMDPPQLLVNVDDLYVQQPVIVLDKETIGLTAGIYEVGVHLEPGTYELQDFIAVHNTAMYLFNEGEEPRVFELIMDEEEDPEILAEKEPLKVSLETGDKIYLELISSLVFHRISNE